MATHRPGAPTLGRQNSLGNGDLLVSSGELRRWREFATSMGCPGARGELQATLVPVAGVDRPVAAGFAAGYLIPLAVSGGGRIGGQSHAAATKHSAGKSDLGDTDAGGGRFAVTSAHLRFISSRYTPTRSAVGFGRRGCPADIVTW